VGCFLSTLEQSLAHHLGTLRTGFGLAGTGFLPDLGGGDFIGAGVSASFLVGVAPLLGERLRGAFSVGGALWLLLLALPGVFLVEGALSALLLGPPGAFLVAERRVVAGLDGWALAGGSGADAATRAGLAAAFVPANTVSRTGTPCLSGSR